MNKSTTTEQSFLAAINSWVQPPAVTIEYRLYYNDDGTPITMTSTDHPNGKYVVITKEQYDSANYNVRVVDGMLKQVEFSAQFKVQLMKSASGMPVVEGHAGIVVGTNDSYTDIEFYGQRNC